MGVLLLLIERQQLVHVLSSPPSFELRPKVINPFSLAHLRALITLGELPLVDIPRAISPS